MFNIKPCCLKYVNVCTVCYNCVDVVQIKRDLNEKRFKKKNDFKIMRFEKYFRKRIFKSMI